MFSPSIFLVISVVTLVNIATTSAAAPAPAPPAPAPPPRPRAFFVFGDSLVDNGNNNYLLTTARADSPPYGIDSFNHLPSGRFSNGLNIPDVISKPIIIYHFRLILDDHI